MAIVKPEIGPGFFDDLGSEDMSIIKAFNEIIANSIDSWIQKGKTKTSRGQLLISIEHKDDALIITDNAAGMNKQDMINAMGFGVAQKSKSEFGDELMGTYGFGLKASTSALGRHFEVISKIANSKIIHSVMPIGKMKDEQSWQSDIEEKINPKSLIEEKFIKSYLKLGKADSGTMIYISDLRTGLNLDDLFINKKYFINELGNSWKMFIEENEFGNPVKISLNGELIKTPEKGYDQGGQIPHSQIDFEFPVYFDVKEAGKLIEKEEWVTGSIWVNNKGGQVDAGGFNVYRRGQLVQRKDHSIFRIILENARVEGELHLDFIPANQRKTYFNTEDPGYKAVRKFLKDGFVPNTAVHSKILNRDVLADSVLLNQWLVEKWYGHFLSIVEDLELPNELKRFKKVNPEEPKLPKGPTPPEGPKSPEPPNPPKEEVFIPLSDDAFKFEGVKYSIIYIKGNCGGNVYAYKVDKNRIQINVDDNIDIVKTAFQKDLLKIVEGPVRSGYQKIAKDLITQSVIQQFLTRTLGPNEALKQSQKWLKFVNRK